MNVHTKPTGGNPAGGNGRDRPRNDHVDPEEPIFGPQQTEALAVVRLILRRKVTEKTRKALAVANPTEWGDLVEFVEHSAGLEPEALWRAVKGQYLSNLKSRHPDQAKLLLDALKAAWAAAEAEDPGDEAEEPGGPPPFRLKTLDSKTFFARSYDRKWLVKRIAVAGQPCIIGGPKKTLKTSVLVDLIISLAVAGKFLNMFGVDRPIRVGFFSGESGEATIQETARRVCESKGIDPAVLDNIVWGFDLPQLSNEEHLAELARVIEENALEVVIIDPLYLCLLAGAGGKQLDPANLYQMGPVFSAVARACLDNDATPMLVHHFRKNRESPYEVPELEDLAFAGIQEFARQWVLLGRRKKYEPGTGRHELWLTVGGSSGHTGEWALDIEEGTMGDDFGGRRWEVSVRAANDARDDFTKQREAAKVEKLSERAKVVAEAKGREDADLALKLATTLRDTFQGKTTQRKLRSAAGWDAKKFDRVAARAETAGWIRPVLVPYQASKTRTEDVPGYELAQDPMVISNDQPW